MTYIWPDHVQSEYETQLPDVRDLYVLWAHEWQKIVTDFLKKQQQQQQQQNRYSYKIFKAERVCVSLYIVSPWIKFMILQAGLLCYEYENY